jgi:hypothetical protein
MVEAVGVEQSNPNPCKYPLLLKIIETITAENKSMVAKMVAVLRRTLRIFTNTTMT